MYCKKCGEKLNEKWIFCPKCKNILSSETVEMSEEKIIEAKKKETKEAIIYIVAFFVGLLGLFTSESVKGIFFLISLISIVTGFIKCSNNKFIKVLFWLFLIFIFIYIIFIIVLVFTCANAVANCNYSCPG